jgi:hypothetical protein
VRVFSGVLIFITVILAAASPQTSSEYHARYGKSDAERFAVRPDVTLSVEYGEDGQACAMRIQPRPRQFQASLNSPAAPMDKMTEVLDEVVPASTRGKEMGPGPVIGINCYRATPPIEYENVIIRIYYGGCENPPKPRGYEVRFKRPACESIRPEPFPKPQTK